MRQNLQPYMKKMKTLIREKKIVYRQSVSCVSKEEGRVIWHIKYTAKKYASVDYDKSIER